MGVRANGWFHGCAAAVLCGLAGLSAAGITAVPTQDEAVRRIEQARDATQNGPAGKSLAQLLADFTTPSVSIAVVKDYEIVLAHAWGQHDAEARLSATPATLYQAASISKPVAAMGVLRAVQEGVFGLDDDINSLLKSWRLIQKADLLAETTVTPRLLMSMTAGATIGGFPGYLPSDTLPTVPQILGYDGAGRRTPANTQPVTIDWQPNTKYEYSGGGVTIMQQALADAAGVPLRITFRRRCSTRSA